MESQRLQLAEVAEQARFREAELQTELSEMKEQASHWNTTKFPALPFEWSFI